MNKEKWSKIKAAGELLGLGEAASLAEIKKAYRRLAKQYHPDTGTKEAGGRVDSGKIRELTAAYRLLLGYCEIFPIPLRPGEDHHDPEEWWHDRFGNDPVWGRGG